ncbi:TerD family protein, partial [Massilia genomosp. 1]
NAAGLRLDFACFGLGTDGKLLDESYMTFFNQPRTPCGGAELIDIPGDLLGFRIDTRLLPANIDQLAITASVDGDGTMSQLSSGYLRLLAGTEENARFAFSGAD